MGALKPSRLLNLAKLFLFKGREVANWYPIHFVIDPSSACNLRCSGCVQGYYNKDKHIRRQIMSYEQFLKIIDKIKKYSLMIDLYNWGEPFLNKDCPAMIQAATDAGIRTKISSNLSLRMTDAYAEEIVRSGLFCLTCSVDGPSQEVYEKYRTRGQLSTVERNVRRLVEIKRRLGSRYPKICYRILVFEWNHEYVDIARETAERWGCDEFYADSGVYMVNGEKCRWDIKEKCWVKTEPRFGHPPDNAPKADKPCAWLSNSMTINADGEVLICCFNTNHNPDMPSIFDSSLPQIWNNDFYRRTRAYTFGKSADREAVFDVCKGCRDL